MHGESFDCVITVVRIVGQSCEVMATASLPPDRRACSAVLSRGEPPQKRVDPRHDLIHFRRDPAQGTCFLGSEVGL